MRKRIAVAIALGVGIFASIYFMKSKVQSDKESFSARTPDDEPLESPRPSSVEPRQVAAPSPLPYEAPPVQGEIREVISIGSEDDLFAALDETNLMSSNELTHMVERLKASDPELIAGIFQRQMQLNDLNRSAQRNRILLVADSWRSEALLPMWKDIALRTGEANAKDRELERTAMSAPEPTEISRGIELEIITAIGNLGILGNQQAEAREALQQLIRQPDPAIHTPFIRERAFYALREADVTASVVLLRNLAADDPLRERLKRR